MYMKVLFSCLVALIFSGCLKNEDPTDYSVIIPSIITPLQVGNSWSYAVQSFDSLGQQTSLPISRIEIVKDTIAGNRIWFVRNDSIFLVVKDDGLWSQYPGETAQLEAKYPTKSGDAYGFRNDSVFVLSTAFQLTTPKGNYSCIQYRHIHYVNGVKTDTETDELYYPNIGLAGVLEYSYTTDGTRYKSKQSLLIDFSFK